MRKRLLGVLATALFVAAACQGAASTAPSAAPSAAPTVAPTAVITPPPLPDLTKTNYAPEAVGHTGGTLVMGIAGEPTSIWYGVYDNFANNVDAFGHSLWGLWNNTADFKYYGQLAADVPTTSNGEVKVNGDKMDVTINMRPGAQWSDGQPINCDDVIFMWKFIMDPAQTGLTAGTEGWSDIGSIDGAGTSTCVVHFNKIYEKYLGLWNQLTPKHYVETVPVKDANTKLYTQADVTKAVWSGPYMPTLWAAAQEIDYVPNAKFWSTIKNATAPFDKVVLKFYSDTDAEIAGFKNGEIDLGLEFNQNHLAAMSGIDPAQIDKTTGVTYEQHTWNLANLTTKFGDAGAKAMMEALHYAYDKDAINARVLGGTVYPSCNFTLNVTWFFADIPCYAHDAAKAESILTAAGFTKGADGILALNGNKAEFKACMRADRQYRIDTMTLVASQLQPLGIKLDITPVPPGNVFAGWSNTAADTPCNTTHGNFDVVEFAWLATPDPASISTLYASQYNPSTSADHSGQNYGRVANPDLDKLLNEIVTTVDLQVIKDDMAKIQAFYIDPANAFPEIALYNWTTVLIKSPKLHNVSNNSSSATQTWNLEDVWKDQ
jgi:peptide/nickel transport system substrate-binding protein